LDPSESNPQFHQQIGLRVAMETIERFEQALGRSIHWHRADRFRAVVRMKPTPGKRAMISMF